MRSAQPPGGTLPSRLNLGCGLDYRDGWWNVDTLPLEAVDQRMNLLDTPWPLPDAHFELILVSHVLEHVPPLLPDGRDALLAVLEEIHRILRADGRLEVVGPHPDVGAAEYWANPTHYRAISPETFHFLDPGYASHIGYATTARFVAEEVAVTKRTTIARSALRMGRSGTALTVHLRERLPFLRPLLDRVPAEFRVVLRKTTR